MMKNIGSVGHAVVVETARGPANTVRGGVSYNLCSARI